MRSKGIPFLQRTGRGDHYVKLQVEVPSNLTRRQVEAMKVFAMDETNRKGTIKGFDDKTKKGMKTHRYLTGSRGGC